MSQQSKPGVEKTVENNPVTKGNKKILVTALIGGLIAAFLIVYSIAQSYNEPTAQDNREAQTMQSR
jgi:hypothetical protein